MPHFDLNADVGEGFPYDAELMAVITSANVACGFHAGDEDTMRTSCAIAAELGVRVGAQVSYRDREGFGRRDVEIGYADLVADLREQVTALRAATAETRTDVGYLKPHGALYNRVVWDEHQAAAVVAACVAEQLPMLGLPGSRALGLARDAGVPTYREFFADRAYDADGRLVPRGRDGAVIAEPALAAARIGRLVGRSTVVSIDGRLVSVEADSICVHGDTPGAVPLARAVRAALESAGATVGAFV